jgi:uncharacterized membrane protein
MSITHHLLTFVLGVIGFLFVVLGWWLMKRPPRHINRLIGYRTSRSMKSQAAWDFSQVYAGKAMRNTGVIMLVAGGMLWPVTLPAYVFPFMSIIILLFAFFPIYLTERKLKLLFDNKGNPTSLK